MKATIQNRFGLSAIVAAMLAACGGAGDDTASTTVQTNAAREQILKGGECSGSCTGGGGTPVPGATNPLPTTAPAPGVVYRESFGPGPQTLRPKSGKGDMRSTFIGTTLGGYWIEWPGSKDTQWITPAGEATWKFTSSISENDPIGNPYELPSPLEVGGMRGVVWADVTDGAATGYPAALMPVTWPTAAWAISIEGFPQPVPGSYLALGLTDSGATLNNLAVVGKVSLELSSAPAGQSLLGWNLWLGGSPRTLLASGTTDDMIYNRLEIRYDPQAQSLQASVNGVSTGSFSVNLGQPRYAGFEGSGTADDFVIRTLP